IVAAATHRPSYRLAALSAEGPDEDAFTLGIAAAERLLGRAPWIGAPVDGIHLVGEFPREAEVGVPEALDAPSVVVERHGPGLAGLGAAFRGASRHEGPGRSLVLVADVARESTDGRSATGAGAVAFALQKAPGAVPVGHGGRHHPVHRAPDANAWVADAVRCSGIPGSGAHGTLYFVAKEAPPVLLAFWRRAHPSMPIVNGTIAPAGLGPAASLAAAQWTLEALARPDAGEWRMVAHVTSEDSWFAGFHATGPFALVEESPPRSAAPTTLPRPASVPSSVLSAVSEGAYVPRARYVENLPSRWRLLGERCGACQTLTFPVRGRCRECGRTEGLVPEALPREGVVLASTVVAPGAHPTEFDPLVAVAGAYGVVLAEMGPKVRATFQVADHDDRPLPIGSRITTALRRLYPMEGEWRYGRKALADRPE
ncbi:MAG: zinc ribbon domain-containing protein, partial [Thermoplasmata archaeon]|nr:zinc ribbon domain-containing protein [Thermoplasmata archaeon]